MTMEFIKEDGYIIGVRYDCLIHKGIVIHNYGIDKIINVTTGVMFDIDLVV